MADRFPDGQLYVNLRGFDPSGQVMAPAKAVRRFLDALQVPAERIPLELDAQAALYRSELAAKRMLVVLDNARDTAQVRPLLPGAPTCLVLVTSRNQLTGLIAADGAHPITLDLLTTDEAHQLLARRLGAHRVAAEPDAVAEIITRLRPAAAAAVAVSMPEGAGPWVENARRALTAARLNKLIKVLNVDVRQAEKLHTLRRDGAAWPSVTSTNGPAYRTPSAPPTARTAVSSPCRAGPPYRTPC